MALTNSGGGVGYRIYGDNSDYKKSIDEAKSYAEGQAASIGKAFKTAMTVAGTAIVSALTLGVKYNANIESYTKTFEGLLQSGEKAKALMNDLQTYAQQTSFDVDGLANSAKTMLAYGLKEDTLLTTIKQLGDISMGSTENMNRLALAFGQMTAKGKVVTQDLRQMQEVGFNPLEYISRMTGESMGDLTTRLEKGGVAVSEVAAAMELATSKGEKFHGMTMLQADTLTGKWNELKEKAQATFGAISKDINDALKNRILPAVTRFIERIDVEKIRKAFKDFVGVVKSLIPVLAAVLPAWAAFKTSMLIQGTLSTVTKGVEKLANILVSGGGLVGALKKAVESFKLLGMAIQLNPILAVTAAVAGLTAAVVALVLNTDPYTASQRAMIDSAREMADAAADEAQAVRDLHAATEESITSGVSQLEYTAKLADELAGLADENGRVADSDRTRAQFILNELNQALGTEYTMTGNLINEYGKLKGSINDLIKQKKAKIILDALEGEYADAVMHAEERKRAAYEAETALQKNLAEQQEINQKILEKDIEMQELLAQGYAETSPEVSTLRGEIAGLGDDLTAHIEAEKDLRKAQKDTQESWKQTQQTIETYEKMSGFALDGAYDKAIEYYDGVSKAASNAAASMSNSQDEYLRNLADDVNIAKWNVDDYGKKLQQGLPTYTKDGLAKAQKELDKKVSDFKAAGGRIVDGIAVGINSNSSAVWSVRSLASRILASFNNRIESHSPSKLFYRAAKWIPAGIAKQLDENREPEIAVESMVDKMKKKMTVETDISHTFAVTAKAAPSTSTIRNVVTLAADVNMDGQKVGYMVLRNLDDAASFALRGNI